MKITLCSIGRTQTSYLKEGIAIYIDRLKHYGKVEWVELPDVPNKGLSKEQLKQKEGELILRHLRNEDELYVLDEAGKSLSSRAFAEWLQKRMNAGTKSIVFQIGGAFGFSDEVYARAQGKISFSAMTFSHEMIRLLLVEQLYRGFTILRGESYHHD